MASQSEKEMRSFNETQLESLSNLIKQQRCTQYKTIHILKEAEEKHKKLVVELDEERQKHEHDTAQGDDITYGLEIERTKLKKDLEQEKVAKEQLEAKLPEHNPIEKVAVLAQAKIPALFIHGDQDTVVPLKENSAEFKARYKAAGQESLVQLIVAEGQGHNFWEGFFRCQELIDFAVEKAKLGAKP